jgi:hypothetical protein
MSVIYRLAKAKNISNGKGGYKKVFPTNYILPRIVRLNYQDENGNFKVKKLRYCPSSSSILFDDNKTESAAAIEFKYGFLEVDPNKDPMLYEFMETIDINGSKKNRNKSKPILFYRLDYAVDAKKEIEDSKTLSEKMSKFWEMSNAELKAVALLWGVKVKGVESSIWMRDLMHKVTNNINQFYKIVDDNDLTRVSFIAKAEEFGLLEKVGKKWYFNGAEVVEVPVGLDPYTHLTGWINKNEIVFETWKKVILEKEQRIAAIPAIEAAVEAMTGHEALEFGMQQKVLTFDRGKGWRFTEEFAELKDEQIFGRALLGAVGANNKTNACNFIDNNPSVKTEIIIRANAARAANAAKKADN